MADEPAHTYLSVPPSLLTDESIESVVTTYSTAGLKPILIHAPTEGGGCTCGKVHDITAQGSSSAGKHPIANNWQKREFTLDDLRDQLARLRFTPNIGLVLGKQPGTGDYLIAVDVDDIDRITKLEDELGKLPETPRCDSGRGYRLFYSAPAEIDTTRLSNVTGLGGEPGVDVKVEGGQVVVAPSLHANGKRYIWTRTGVVTPLPVQWAMELLKKPEKPDWIEKYTPSTLLNAKSARRRAERYLEVAVTGEARALAACGQGMRNNTLFRSACRCFELCAGLYLGKEWQWVHDELLRAARSAGLPDTEVRKTLASADRTVRESGKVLSPVALADPAEPKPPADPDSPETDPPELITTGGVTRPVRPIIKVNTELLDNSDQAIAALCKDEGIFQREKRLVCITRVGRVESETSSSVASDDGVTHRQLVEGSPQIHFLTRPVIKSRLTKFAVFQKWVTSSNSYKSILPPDDIVGHIHDCGEWSGIRPLTGITETPTFGPRGVITQQPGYNFDTGYLYVPSGNFPPVKDEDATQANARWAFAELSKVFADFPYVNDAHRSVPIAAILTLIARPAIDGSIPAVLFDASTRGSGKTLQTDAIAMILTGRGAPRMNYTSDEVELQKILAGYALKGSPFICLDNVPAMRPFGGGPIDRCITAKDEVELRVLGSLNIPALPWRALIMATGNNMTLYGDTSRRVLMARLEPTEESPEKRTNFKHHNLLEYVRAQRNRLVSAALLILRAYHRAGRPDMGCDQWGSFEEWATLIPRAIVFAGGADPMKSRPEQDKDVDIEAQALSCLIEQLPMLNARIRIIDPTVGEGLAARSIIAALYEQSPEWSEFEPLREAVETLCRRFGKSVSKPDAISLGYKLRSLRSRVIDGRRLIGAPGEAHVTLWRVERAL